MATITSPRAASPASTPRIKSPSIAETPTSSTRGSFEVTRGTAPPPSRRNRAALRDYYNLKSKPQVQQGTGQLSRTASITSTTSETSTVLSSATLTENNSTTSTLTAHLDTTDFDAQEYITGLLEKSSLREILKVEATLVSEIRNLDGERKALVYGNYSKLIKAVGTIGDMQRSMNEDGKGLTEVGKLEAQMEGLRMTVRELAGPEDSSDAAERAARKKAKERNRQKEVVKWVIGAPTRFRQMLDEEKTEEAEKQWAVVRGYLDHWTGVSGVSELRRTCEDIMKGSEVVGNVQHEEDG